MQFAAGTKVTVQTTKQGNVTGTVIDPGMQAFGDLVLEKSNGREVVIPTDQIESWDVKESGTRTLGL